jgi:hypothetical protein
MTIQWFAVLNKFADGFIFGCGFFVALCIFCWGLNWKRERDSAKEQTP